MSTLPRTLRNLWRIGFKVIQKPVPSSLSTDTETNTMRTTRNYHVCLPWDNIANASRIFKLIGVLNPVRTRWVDYKEKELDASQVEPGWHGWLAYMVNKPPTEDKILQTGVRAWETPEHRPNMSLSRAAFKTYST
ncbi:hypothetical protein PRK78_002047 [Emydomyces testavorans]|uniref:NADH dehydrogenase [ubiquinone] 1 alpha subcomplex subunit n=1 Tax=Emydomyces testavorans TaxID=2070801 RepID=A0AAF0DEY6_9EURO|nr:hypothetical protein PRK78_002047 [Emydomyces testavorans]